MRFRKIREVLADRSGEAALSYGFFIVFVAFVLMVGVMSLADSVESIFNVVADAVVANVGTGAGAP